MPAISFLQYSSAGATNRQAMVADTELMQELSHINFPSPQLI